MKQMMKDAAILFAITLISGLLLGIVYQVTKDPLQSKMKNKCRLPVMKCLPKQIILKI